MNESSVDRAKHPDDEGLADLALHLLPSDRAEEMVRHLQVCGSCEERFLAMAGEAERASARSAQLLAEQSREASPAARATRDSANAPGILDRLRELFAGPSWSWGVVPIAAAALALLILLPRSSDDIPLGRLPQPTGEVLRRSSLPPADRESLRVGLDAYARGDWGAAVRGLQDVEADGALESLRRIYLGSALAHEGRYPEVMTVLESVPFAEIPEPWSGEGRWALYVALDRMGRTDRAQEILDTLQDVPGEVGDRARSISEKETGP